MRIAKFLAVFVLVTGLVYLVVFGLNFNVFKTVFTNQEALAEGSEWIEKTYSLAGMTEFVAAHPDLVSVVFALHGYHFNPAAQLSALNPAGNGRNHPLSAAACLRRSR